MLITVIVFLLTLLFLVVSHELGHFLTAKKFGVKVLEFGVGLPPRIFKKRLWGTLFTINALPIGGFVKLMGEDEKDSEVRLHEESFASKSVNQRIIMVLSGVVINLILSWILFYIVLYFQDFKIIYPTAESVVEVINVEDNFPAKDAGIKVGDRVFKINDGEVKNIDQVVSEIRSSVNKPVKLVVGEVNGWGTREVMITPKSVGPTESRIGVAFSPLPFKQYDTVLAKVFSAPLYSLDLIGLTLGGLGKLVSDLFRADLTQVCQSVAGPIGLTSAANTIVSGGLKQTIPYLWFVGLLSLSLAVLNSLPMPALDGGRVLFYLYELVTRRKPNPDIERWAHTIGFTILMALMLLVTTSDIRRALTGGCS